MGVGYHTIFPKICPTVFRVRNTARGNKTIRIFNYPIKNGAVRDLMDIPYTSEADIRHELLKGNLRIKLETREARVVESNINLLQFDPCHKAFLESVGITVGLDTLGATPYVFKQGVPLVGARDSINRIFTVPDKFLQGALGNNDFRITIIHNGRTLIETTDYIVSESGGAGTGFDTIEMVSLTPNEYSQLISSYMVRS